MYPLPILRARALPTPFPWLCVCSALALSLNVDLTATLIDVLDGSGAGMQGAGVLMLGPRTGVVGRRVVRLLYVYRCYHHLEIRASTLLDTFFLRPSCSRCQC
ncbi:hypothetical protein DFH07DRAFT_843759 [Mycena maculata]|uniref:Secreted protein n=1 Tax=Mycena maculata TaxID=230809 RepID=A0AAD7I5B8_9AGAR|nr:hypothetical protein DFH07DRAFT_843759 [Mycena maculata]